MKKKENPIKKKILAEFKSRGMFAQALETNVPGFPDAIVSTPFGLKLIEFKSVQYKRDKKCSSVFEITQPPFYVRYLQDGGSPDDLFVFLYVDNADEKKFYFISIDREIALALPTISMGFLLFNCLSSTTVEGLVSKFLECFKK